MPVTRAVRLAGAKGRGDVSVSIEIANESGAVVDTDAILDCARYSLDEMGVNPLAELSILLVDVAYMAELNHRWMGGDGPTDVLAFPIVSVSRLRRYMPAGVPKDGARRMWS